MHDRAEFILNFFCPKNEEPGLKNRVLNLLKNLASNFFWIFYVNAQTSCL